MEDIIKLLEKHGKAFEEFKKANDLRLISIEKQDFIDPILAEKTEKLDEELTKLQESIYKIERKLSLPPDLGVGRWDDGYYYGERMEGFKHYIKTGQAVDLVSHKSFSTEDNYAGGYAVPVQLDAQLNNYLFDASVMRQIANVRTAYSGDYKIALNTGGLEAGWYWGP